MSIALFVNPRSGRNRRDPSGIARLASALGNAGEVLSPSVEELPGVAARLAAQPPRVIAISGGDGTMHILLDQLLPAFAGRDLPPLALLTGGTMNVVAHSLRLVADPEAFLAVLAHDTRAGRPIETVTRRCLRIGGQHGFVFANGVFATFLEEYYGATDYGPGRAVWVGLRAIASAAVGGRYGKETLRPFRGGVCIDGARLERRDHTAISASTVSEVGLGFKVNHRADEDTERFSVVAVTCPPWNLLADVPSVRGGRGFAPEHATAHLANQLVLEPDPEQPMAYTIDGDLYCTTTPLAIAPGPALRLVKPSEALGRAAGDRETAGDLPRGPPGTTIGDRS